jgi:hypothetical protein
MPKLQKIFTRFLHIMVKKPKNNNHFLFILWWLGVYLHEKNTCHDILKNANMFQKWLKWFLPYMKFIIVISTIKKHKAMAQIDIVV